MVNKEVVMQTIRRMLDSEIDDATIKATLQDTGLSAGEAEKYLAEAKGIAPQKPSPTEEQADEKIAKKTAEKVREHIDAARTETELRETTAHAAIEEHGKKLEEVHADVKSLHEKVPSFQQAQAADTGPLNTRLSRIEADISEIKSSNSALQGLLKKIIEANRQVLLELQKKK